MAFRTPDYREKWRYQHQDRGTDTGASHVSVLAVSPADSPATGVAVGSRTRAASTHWSAPGQKRAVFRHLDEGCGGR